MQTASTTPTETAAQASRSGWRAIAPAWTRRVAGVVQRDVGAGDRRGAGAAVGLQHVAVEDDLALAERLQIADRAQGPPDQALDLVRPARLATPGRLAGRPARARSPGAASTRR